MSTQVFTLAKSCIKYSLGAALTCVFICWIPQTASADWTVDFSRRSKVTRDQDLQESSSTDGRAPASVRAHDSGDSKTQTPEVADGAASGKSGKGLFDTIFDAGEPVQEIVILNTDRGFVPATVRVRKGGRYKINIVNVNDKEKNVSFILDGFSEHHATYYGKVKTFTLEPKKEGIYSFISPETAAEGKLIVFNPQISVRAPASENSK